MASFTTPIFDSKKDLVELKDYERLLINQLSIHPTNFLKQQFLTEILDDLYEGLHFVATPSYNHIDALHVQAIKRREVVAALDPALHLVWHSSTIYIKPLPQFLLRPKFWAKYLANSTEDRARVLGFLRTYAFLVQDDVDFGIAQDLNLLPKSLTYLDFAEFIIQFRHLCDTSVAKRYHFGQMRLMRLNWAVRVVQKGWYYHETRYDTAQFMREYGAVLFFLFALFSLALSALQVMGQLGMSDASKPHAFHFAGLIFWFFVTLVRGMVLGIIFLWLSQFSFAVKMRPKRKNIASLA